MLITPSGNNRSDDPGEMFLGLTAGTGLTGMGNRHLINGRQAPPSTLVYHILDRGRPEGCPSEIFYCAVRADRPPNNVKPYLPSTKPTPARMLQMYPPLPFFASLCFLTCSRAMISSK